MKSSKLGLGMVGAMVGLWSLIILAPWTAQAQVVKIKEELPPAAAPEAKEQEPRVVLHIVHEGEELHMLAAYYYGDARQWPRIYQANRDLIKNPNRITKGEILSIPVPDDWQPMMPYEQFFQKATAGAPVVEAPEAAPAEETKPEEKKPEEKKPAGAKPGEKKAPEKKS